MSEKQNSRDRTHTYTAFIAIAMTMLLSLWNMFASQDRGQADLAPTSDFPLEKELSAVCHMPLPNQGAGTRCMTVARTRSS